MFAVKPNPTDIDSDPPVSTPERSALFRAVNAENQDAIRDLLDQGINPNFREANFAGMTPLIRAVRRGHVPIVRLLLLSGANASIQDHLGYSPLDYCTDPFGRLPKDHHADAAIPTDYQDIINLLEWQLLPELRGRRQPA